MNEEKFSISFFTIRLDRSTYSKSLYTVRDYAFLDTLFDDAHSLPPQQKILSSTSLPFKTHLD